MRIHHVDLHAADYKAWRQGLSLAEFSRTMDAVAAAVEAGDEAFLESLPFIERITYVDGTVRTIARVSVRLEE